MPCNCCRKVKKSNREEINFKFFFSSFNEGCLGVVVDAIVWVRAVAIKVWENICIPTHLLCPPHTSTEKTDTAHALSTLQWWLTTNFHTVTAFTNTDKHYWQIDKATGNPKIVQEQLCIQVLPWMWLECVILYLGSQWFGKVANVAADITGLFQDILAPWRWTRTKSENTAQRHSVQNAIRP